jgi:hypothetical protein
VKFRIAENGIAGVSCGSALRALASLLSRLERASAGRKRYAYPWCFGVAHRAADPAQHPMAGRLGPNALDLSPEEFRALLKGRRGAIKAFLPDPNRIAAIGNVAGRRRPRSGQGARGTISARGARDYGRNQLKNEG